MVQYKSPDMPIENVNAAQPMPRTVEGRTPAWDLVIADARGAGISAQVIADMADRHALGLAKYGAALTAGDGRNHLVDTYQEQLDHVVYLRQELESLRALIDAQEAGT